MRSAVQLHNEATRESAVVIRIHNYDAFIFTFVPLFPSFLF
jgi:hypothetical protein